MEVILLEEIPALGKPRDVVKVADGYGRNYLIPKGKALEATTNNIKALKHQENVAKSKLGKVKREAENIAKKIEAISCTISKQTGEEDRLFGSVTSMDIVESIKEEGLEIDKKKVILEEPIKKLGIYKVPIKLHPEVTADLKVWVVKA